MAYEITIDAAGRLIIPKPLRERLHLRAGATLHLTEHEGTLVLSPERPEARLIERGGFLVLDVDRPGSTASADQTRAERLGSLIEYALRR